MNIAFVVPKLVKQGPVLVVYEIVKEMLRRGHSCTVYYFDTVEKYKDSVQEMPCPTICIGIKDDLPWQDIDVINAHCWRAMFYVYLHLKQVHRNGIRYVATIHENMYLSTGGNHGKLYTWLFTHWYVYLLKKADLRVALSKTVIKDAYEEVFKGYPMTYIYNTRTVKFDESLSEEERESLENFKGEDILLGLNARLDKVKAVDVIIEALPMLDGYKLFVVGDGKEKESLQRLAKDWGVSERVFFAGYKNNAFRYNQYYDIFMMPSRSEGFPLGLTEAMAYKCNCVISDIPIFKEFFTENEMSFSRLNDPQDLARAVREATKHPKGEVAYEKYSSCYSPVIFGDMYEKVFLGKNNPHE